MKMFIYSTALVILSLSLEVSGSSFLSDLLDAERYDEDSYERMFPDDEILVSRRRPDFNDDFSEEQKMNDAESKTVITSNFNNGGKTPMIVNGIDISKLPANYHKTTKFTKVIGGQKVNFTVTIDKTTDPKTGFSSVSVEQSSDGGMKTCKSSESCGKGNFCRELMYGNYCANCSHVNENCDSNAQCCGTTGTLCVRGLCQTGYKAGDAETLCKVEKDCGTGMCCARTFMKKNGECKPLAKEGESCAASRSEIGVILHGGLCPCTGALECSSGSWTESFFGGSMNSILGGNTCRVKGSEHEKSGWMSEFFDDADREDMFRR